MRLVLDTLLPPRCSGCGRAGAHLCASCIGTAREASSAADRFVAPDAGVVIGTSLVLGIGAVRHEGSVRRAIGSLKYGGARATAGPLAAVATPALRRLLAISGPAPLVPVPIHVGRERERGFNQARELADELGRIAGLAVLDVLERRQVTARQHRLDRMARLRNLRRAIGVRDGTRAPRRLIVVDDILTTSATLEACAAALMAAGAIEVYGFAIAREV